MSECDHPIVHGICRSCRRIFLSAPPCGHEAEIQRLKDELSSSIAVAEGRSRTQGAPLPSHVAENYRNIEEALRKTLTPDEVVVKWLLFTKADEAANPTSLIAAFVRSLSTEPLRVRVPPLEGEARAEEVFAIMRAIEQRAMPDLDTRGAASQRIIRRIALWHLETIEALRSGERGIGGMPFERDTMSHDPPEAPPVS